jgi:hypothetical protein
MPMVWVSLPRPPTLAASSWLLTFAFRFCHWGTCTHLCCSFLLLLLYA